LHHLIEGAFALDELVGRTAFDDLPSLHDEDLIVVGNCVESVRNCDDCRIGKALFQYFLDEVVCPHIDIGGGFIKDQNLVASQQSSRKTQQLLLSDRE